MFWERNSSLINVENFALTLNLINMITGGVPVTAASGENFKVVNLE
ncbi:hypothetical protein [Leptotrichia sp. OH3620_COT-345]|nr:hypothetical protein [Leptotrichia sp. OH3620_COT-345]